MQNQANAPIATHPSISGTLAGPHSRPPVPSTCDGGKRSDNIVEVYDLDCAGRKSEGASGGFGNLEVDAFSHISHSG